MSYDEYIKSFDLDEHDHDLLIVERDYDWRGATYRVRFREGHSHTGWGKTLPEALYNLVARLETTAAQVKAIAIAEEATPIQLALAPDLCLDCEGRGTTKELEPEDVAAGDDYLDFLTCSTCSGSGRRGHTVARERGVAR